MPVKAKTKFSRAERILKDSNVPFEEVVCVRAAGDTLSRYEEIVYKAPNGTLMVSEIKLSTANQKTIIVSTERFDIRF